MLKRRPPDYGRVRFWLDGGYDRDQVEDCEYHPAHRWTIIRVGDTDPNHSNPDEQMCICVGCFVPRCGYTTEENPCMLPRHHPEKHLFSDGSTEDEHDPWRNSTKPDPPYIPGVSK